jgi:hypothetical protein
MRAKQLHATQEFHCVVYQWASALALPAEKFDFARRRQVGVNRDADFSWR